MTTAIHMGVLALGLMVGAILFAIVLLGALPAQPIIIVMLVWAFVAGILTLMGK
jgi:hypothetical protein